MMVHVYVKTQPGATIPTYAKPGDAGMDLHAFCNCGIEPSETVVVPTGIQIAIPQGYFGSLRERSSLAVRGIRLGGGVIDSGYRGNIMCVLTNLGKVPFIIERGDRIAQLIIQPYEEALMVEAKELPPSERGTAGFGSTGR